MRNALDFVPINIELGTHIIKACNCRSVEGCNSLGTAPRTIGFAAAEHIYRPYLIIVDRSAYNVLIIVILTVEIADIGVGITFVSELFPRNLVITARAVFRPSQRNRSVFIIRNARYRYS